LRDAKIATGKTCMESMRKLAKKNNIRKDMRIIRKNDLHIARSGERFALGTMQLCWCTTVIQIVKILERRLRTKEHVEKVSLTDSGMIERSKRTRPIEAVLLNRSC